MATQLVLLDSRPDTWKLDRRTREIGRRGLAEAREALRRAGGPNGGPGRSSQAA